jgi:uncharacterized protein YndB with AHSA1/START domain
MTQAGLTKDAGWQIGVSKVVERSAGAVWDFVTSAEGVAIWLGDGVDSLADPGAGYETVAGVRGEVRSFRALDRVRPTWQPPDWDHDTTVQLTVRSAGDGRATLRVHQERLADADERERQRAHWRAVVTALGAALTRT